MCLESDAAAGVERLVIRSPWFNVGYNEQNYTNFGELSIFDNTIWRGRHCAMRCVVGALHHCNRRAAFVSDGAAADIAVEKSAMFLSLP